MAKLSIVREHIDRPGSGEPRIVVSDLPKGESVIGCARLSVKYVAEGEESFDFGSRRPVRLVAGQLMVVGRHAPARACIPRGRATGLCLYLPGLDDLGLDADATLLAHGPLVFGAEGNPLGDALRTITARIDRGGVPEAMLDAMLADAARRCRATVESSGSVAAALGILRPGTARELLRRTEVARAYLHDVTGRRVPLAELSRVAGVSSYHLARCFKAWVGVPPAAYHRNLRLDRARTRLAAGGLSVAEAATEAGFCEQAAFTRAFRRRHGAAPVAFARAARHGTRETRD